MWVLLGLLFVLAFGSKIGGVIARVLLGVLSKGGLLSNIRVDDCRKITITVHAIKFSFWQCLWKFVRAPTQEHLLCVDIPGVHVLMVVDEAARVRKEDSATTDDLHDLALLDLTMSLKSIQHTIWTPIRAWSQRFHFVCYFVHLVAVNITSISMDVVRSEQGEHEALVSITHGSVCAYANYDTNLGEVLCGVKLSQHNATRCVVSSADTKLEIGPTELKVWVPISRNSDDLRAPLPRSCLVSCEFVKAEVDFLQLVRLASKEDSLEIGGARKTQDRSSSVGDNASLLVLRLVGALPSEVGFLLRAMEIKLVNNVVPGAAHAECVVKLGASSVRLIDPTQRRIGESDKEDDRSLAEERKLSLELGSLNIGLRSDETQHRLAPDLLKMDSLRCDLEAKLASYAILESADEEDVDEGVLMLSCNSRFCGESKGLSIAVDSELQPWVSCLHAAIERANRLKRASTPSRSPSEERCSGSLFDAVFETTALAMEVQFKAVQTEIVFSPLEKECVVLPAGVPSLQLVAEEMNVFAHPFIGEETLGVRSKADIQCSRLKVLYWSSDRLTRNCFVSLDFTRVFVEPVSLMNVNQSPAEVEMEAEWLEVKWTPEAIHSIGGMLELGVYVASPFLKESQDKNDPFGDGWDIDARKSVPSLKTIEEVVADKVCESERTKFRCTVKRSLVLFAYNFEELKHIDYVTVDSFTMSVEETTGRFRISVSQTKIYHVQPDEDRSFTNPTFGNQRPPRRTSSTFNSKRAQSKPPDRKRSRYPSSSLGIGIGSVKENAHYFAVQSFALEENKLPNCPKKVVDIYVDNVRLDWDLPSQVRVMELVRRITFSVWEMLYRVRSGYAIYCTSHDSVYNRPHGVNPPMEDAAENERCAALLSKLISASGDGLHRLHATNIAVDAKITSATHLQLRIGLFGGEDMPDLWEFRNISFRFNSHELLMINSVHVRHTMNKRRDYVFGEFEAMLQLRMAACGHVGDANKSRSDGMLVDIEGLFVRLPTDVPFLDHLVQMQNAFAPHLESLDTIAASFWRPQHDIFYQYFLRVPVTSGMMNLWLSLENLTLECLDVPFESWLERMYPLWLEELQEQELRAQVLEEQVTTLKLTNADLLCEDAYQEMKALLVEKNSKIYFQKVKKLQAKYHQHREPDENSCGSLFCIRIGHLSADAAFEGDAKKTVKRMRSLDEASDAFAGIFALSGRTYSSYTPAFDLLEEIRLDVAVCELAVQMRNFSTPLLVCDRIGVTGDVIVAVCSATGPNCESEMFRFSAGLRCFTDLSLEVVCPIVYFSPSYLYTLDEIACLAQGLLPLLLLDVDKHHGTPPWDIMRRLFHGKASVRLQSAAIRLLCSSTSFDVTDYLEVSIQRLTLDYSTGKVDVNLYRLTAKIDPGALSNIAEFSNINVEVWTKWSSEGNSSIHYGFPIQYHADAICGAGEEDNVVLDAVASRIHRVGEHHQQGNIRKSHPLTFYQASGLSVYIRGKICPGSAEIGSPTTKDGWSKREIATRTAIVLYTKHVEWLIRFAGLYLKLPPYPFPRRKRTRTITSATASPPSLLRICNGITIEEFTIVGLDLALYHSEKYPVGIRAFVNEQIVMSGAILASTHKIFQAPRVQATKKSKVRRLRVPFDNQVWIVHDVTVSVQDIQVRICTPQSGSRGESLVSVKLMALKVGGGSEHFPMHDDSAALHPASPAPVPEERGESFSGGGNPSEARARTKKNILEHFSIPQHNPYCFRDSDQDSRAEIAEANELEQNDERNYQAAFVEEFRRLGFLMGLSAREARILVTLDTVETLIDIVENWMRIITVCVPELLGTSDDAVPADDAAAADAANAADTESSPKKITSLAEDPKFGAIFYQSIGREQSGSFSSNPSVPKTPPEDLAGAGSPDSVVQIHADEQFQGGANIVESFFMVKFTDCQISIQDNLHKGSVLLALNCGSLKDSISPDSSHEFVDLKVDGLQLFTAPLDIDVKSRIIWLKALSDGSYCPSSYGLLKQVIAPIPTKVAIWVDRDVTVLNRVDLQIPTIQVGLNVISKDILQNLAHAMTTLISAKLQEKMAPDYSKMLQVNRVADSDPRSIHNLRALRKQLKWKIAHLQWRQTCRWNYYVSERANVAFTAAENSRNLSFEVETSPLFRQRKTSSASISSMTTNMSISGAGATHCDTDHFTDDLHRLTQQYESISEVLHGMVKLEQKKKQTLPNVELDFHLQSASLTLSGTNMDIVRVSMSSLRFKMKQFEDQSGSFTLTLQDLSTHNLCPGTPYPDLLQPSSTSNTWGGGNAFLRVDAEIAAPVGGITVVKHFEVNVHPLQVCITQEVILQLVAFFSSSTAANSTLDEKRDEVRSRFLQARPASASTDGLVGSALKKAVRVAGKAAHPLGLGRHRDDSDHSMAGRTRSLSLMHEEASMWMSKVGANEPNETQLLLRGDEDLPHAAEQTPDSADREISEMKDRAKTNILFKRIRIGTVEVVVTYKNKKSHHHNQQTLEDMRGFEVKMHALVYCDKTCSLMDLMLRIRRDVILDILSQVGRNFTNIGNFLRDQFDITRWAQFDALAPLKTLSTTVTSLATVSSVSPAPALIPKANTMEMSPRKRAATSAATHAQSTTQKFQLELPESHRALRKKHTPSNVRPVEAVSRSISGSSSPAPSPRRDQQDRDQEAEPDSEHHQQHHHRSTAGKAKNALAHLFSKKKSGSSSSPSSPPASQQQRPVESFSKMDAASSAVSSSATKQTDMSTTKA